VGGGYQAALLDLRHQAAASSAAAGSCLLPFAEYMASSARLIISDKDSGRIPRARLHTANR
jgi:hypothetical protein